MPGLLKRESKTVEPVDVFDRFDRMFEEWSRMLPWRRAAEEMIRVDEYRENGTLVVRADLPGIDPEKDVELTVADGMLHISAERREEEKTEEKGYMRQELRYGSFARTLALPKGVSGADIKASYRNGILEIRVPAPEAEPAKKIPIEKS
jgi:HSP20 family protein